MFVLVLILLLLAAVFGVLGAVLKAVAFLVLTAVLTVTVLVALAWWGIKRKARVPGRVRPRDHAAALHPVPRERGPARGGRPAPAPRRPLLTEAAPARCHPGEPAPVREWRPTNEIEHIPSRSSGVLPSIAELESA
jgi:hypothetical protein